MAPPKIRSKGFRVRGVRLFGPKITKPIREKMNLDSPLVRQLNGLKGAGDVRVSPTESQFQVSQPVSVKLNSVTVGQSSVTASSDPSRMSFLQKQESQVSTLDPRFRGDDVHRTGESKDPNVVYLHSGIDLVDLFKRVFHLGKYRRAPVTDAQDQVPIATVDYGDAKVNAKMAEDFRSNAFTVGRGLRRYSKFLGDHLRRRLREMGEGHHWLDGGAGRASAMRTHLKKARLVSKPRMTAVAMQKPAERGLDRLLVEHGDRFRYFSGKPVEQLAVEDVGKVDLITDIYGALTYTPHPDQVIAKYLELLNIGGELQAMIPTIDLTNMKISMYRGRHDRWSPDPKPQSLISIKDGDGQEVSLVEWIRSIEGIEIVEVRRVTELVEDPYVRIVIRKTSDDVRVPELELTDIQPGRPPSRFYKLAE